LIIILGFSYFNYDKSNKIAFFVVYLVPITEDVYFNEFQFLVYIKYKKILRKLQETITEKVKCVKMTKEYQDNMLFNCSFGTSGEDLGNIEINKNLKDFNFTGQDVEIISVSPFAIKYMDNLQNIKSGDLFNKKVYILDKSLISIDNENRQFDITGIMSDNRFNYDKLNLTIAFLSSNSQERIEDVSCIVEKLNEKNYTLHCVSRDEISGKLQSAASDLGKDILVVNILKSSNNANNTNDFNSIIINNIHNKKEKGLSAAGIVAIVLVLLFVAVISGILLVLIKSKKNIGLPLEKYDKKNSSFNILNDSKN
jgi:hypothetical protein